MFQQVERRGMLFERLDNLLGVALITGEVVLANDYGAESRRGGLPPGHPPIACYIGLPVYSGDELIGLVALGCDLGQGFYYARPMRFNDALTWAKAFTWPASNPDSNV